MSQSASLPSVVIVGRPNVGKSTLFNAILGRRRAIVGDEPGITRDRIHGEAVHRGRRFELIDTGGLLPDDKDLIPSEIFKQARVALADAAHVIFLVDGRAEITSSDRELVQLLRRLGKPMTLAVNKIDTAAREGLVDEFLRMGVIEWGLSDRRRLERDLRRLLNRYRGLPLKEWRAPSALILWPLFTLTLMAIIAIQQRKIRQLSSGPGGNKKI